MFKSRRFTISVRVLLLLVLLLAVFLAWRANRARRQRDSVAAVQKFGGWVRSDYELVPGPVKVAQGNRLWRRQRGTLALDLKELRLHNSKTTKTGRDRFKASMPNLKTLE
jgi:hypothetical protein